MTALLLLFWIVLGILLQLVLFLGASFYRHWGQFQQIKNRATGPDVDPAPRLDSSASVAAWRGLRGFRVERKITEDQDAAICSFYLKPNDGQALPDFLPGQFLTFELDLPEGEKLVRCYSLSDAPTPEHYRVSIKRVPPPPGQPQLPPGRTSNYFHDHVAVGSTLQVRAPAGHFFLDAGTAPVVLIAGGIGITPMLSMLNWSLEQQPDREIWLFYGVRNRREAAMREHLESQARQHANFHLHFCHSDPLPDEAAGSDYHHAGRVSIDLLRMQIPLKPYHFYICGPTPMMASLVAGLEDWGVPDSRIHFEAFGPASVPRRKPVGTIENAIADKADIVVTFTKSGRQLPWRTDAGSLLEFAEQAGVKVDSGCRGGACGSCQTAIAAGEVSYRQAPDFDPEPGSCLLCVCTPKTSVTLEA